MICKKCGQNVQDGVAFCPACGENLAEVQQPAPAPAPEPSAEEKLLTEIRDLLKNKQ